MRFRYLTGLLAVISLAGSVEVLAQDEAQAEQQPSTPELSSESPSPVQEASEKEQTLGAELEPHQDADDVIQETDRQFEKAQEELEQRFREVEKESPVEPSSEASNIDDILTPSSDPKVRKALEETERRFEEASRKIEKSFKDAERSVPAEVSGAGAASGSKMDALEESDRSHDK